MAKDDYYVMVAKVLVFLYRKLKNKMPIETLEYLQPNTKNFPVNEEYFNYVLEHMTKKNLIEGVDLVYYSGSRIADIKLTDEIRITIENSKIRKVLKEVPMAAAIMQIFT